MSAYVVDCVLVIIFMLMLTGLWWSLAPAAINPDRNYDYDVYWEDPCVPAMRKAMEEMTPYLPERFKQLSDGYWYFMLQLTEEGRQDFEFAAQTWRDTVLQCWRTP